MNRKQSIISHLAVLAVGIFSTTVVLSYSHTCPPPTRITPLLKVTHVMNGQTKWCIGITNDYMLTAGGSNWIQFEFLYNYKTK